MTLEAMKVLALRDSRTLGIQALVRAIPGARPVISPNWPEAIDDFLRAHWVFVADPPDAEFILAPAAQLREYERRHIFTGDCDDAATFACALLAAVHYPCWLSAIRLPAHSEFSHVYAQAPIGGEVIDIDPTVDVSQLPISDYEERLIVGVYE